MGGHHIPEIPPTQTIPGLADLLDRVTTCEELLGVTVSAITDRVIEHAKANGVARPNVNAVLNAAIERVLTSWQQDRPDLWQAYCREIGIPLDH